MRIYKASYKDRNGKQWKSPKWYVDIFDHNQLQQRIQGVCSFNCVNGV
jgi:hypothetical protein